MGKFRLRLRLSFCLVGFGGLLCPACGARVAQTMESAQKDSAIQSVDMDHPDHADGSVESMIPHQQHTGPI